MKSVVMIVLLFFLAGRADASAFKSFSAKVNDTAVRTAIKRAITKAGVMQSFHYPKSVERFYNQQEFQPAWVNGGKEVSKTWAALFMLDCVLQFGLNRDDYHPKELLSSTMHDIVEERSKLGTDQIARFDMMLTDAVITFMNHLHFGKLNPVYAVEKIDEGKISGFCADDLLIMARGQKDFMSAVLDVQPKCKEYVLMQEYMMVLKGQYMEDCYEAPKGIVRKLAINMERLRWAAPQDSIYIHINIPAYALKLQLPDTAYLFKVIVGKPGTPTPTLRSAITHFTTAPDWKVPEKIFTTKILPKAIINPAYLEVNHFAIYDFNGNYVPALKDSLLRVRNHPKKYFIRQSADCDNALGLVVFRFRNAFGIYLHDTPEQYFFKCETRALSHGCVRVEEAEKLAGLLLAVDGQKKSMRSLHQAMSSYLSKIFRLKRAVPLQITYLTCAMSDMGVIEYEDIYQQDKALELALYGPDQPLDVKKVKQKM